MLRNAYLAKRTCNIDALFGCSITSCGLGGHCVEGCHYATLKRRIWAIESALPLLAAHPGPRLAVTIVHPKWEAEVGKMSDLNIDAVRQWNYRRLRKLRSEPISRWRLRGFSERRAGRDRAMGRRNSTDCGWCHPGPATIHIYNRAEIPRSSPGPTHSRYSARSSSWLGNSHTGRSALPSSASLMKAKVMAAKTATRASRLQLRGGPNGTRGYYPYRFATGSSRSDVPGVGLRSSKSPDSDISPESSGNDYCAPRCRLAMQLRTIAALPHSATYLPPSNTQYKPIIP